MLDIENVFTLGRLAYRRLLVDPQSASLYVGANGHLFRLWAYNINITESTDGLYAHVELPVSRADAEECRRAGHAECTNGVRLMFLKEEPDFVASFDIDRYVYFFFRELAIEREHCERTVFSRVARICKKDIGGKNVLRQVWTTFVKARLNCSIASKFPTYFNEI
ncbi:unnamed protein product, partial [Onchocerca flexuosa]|uniref:Sema domain-containing protein n=1 Tax=Onchocerca flexuosa TaxID=387005 RepID=A0A183I7I9_9BILA